MSTRRLGWLLAAALALLAPATVAAQDVEDVLSRYTGVNADGFLQPLADVLGASLGSGWARSANIEPGFHVRLSAVLAGAPISDEARTFTGTTEDFSPTTTAQVPTIFGPAETVAVSGAGGTTFRFPGGLDTDLMGTVAPQLTVGTVAGTEAMVRWFSVDLGDDYGSISLVGLGARHDIDQYFADSLPLDLAAGVYWQSFEIGDVVAASTVSVMAHGSRDFSLLTLYGGLGYETSSTDITYTQEDGVTSVDISLDGANSIRATAGVAVRLLVVGVFADYTLASQNTFTLGLELGR